MGVIESFVSAARMERALEIMGGNTFSIDDAAKAFKIIPSKPQLSALSSVPYTENTLTECKDTHILVAFFPLSIVNIRDVASQVFSSKFWYKHEPFAMNLGETIWQLIQKTPAPNSFLKTLDEHESVFLSKCDEIPRVRRMVYAIVGRYVTTGERLFENVYVRCSDRDAFGVRLGVSGIGSDGLNITNEFGNKRNKNLCLVPARKFDQR